MSVTTPSVKMFAPVDAIPVLTSGRNASGFTTGHEPKFVLDNDPDTFYQADSYDDKAIYIDLGSAVAVDSIVFWLHNYNEAYGFRKRWEISYSDDDSTYTPLTPKIFKQQRDRDAYTPITVDEFSSQVTARYWKLEFLFFDVFGQSEFLEISCIWFMNDYSLPYKHQRPAQQSLVHHNNDSTTRSGHRFSTPAGFGKQRIIQRDYCFTAEADQYENLKGAYDAARGGNLPIILQADFNSDVYVAVHFDRPLQEGRQEHEQYLPHLQFKELGHKRVPFIDYRLYPLPETIALWRFNENGLDESDSENDFTTVTYVESDYDNGGIVEQGNTAFLGIIGKIFRIPAIDAGDFDFGTSDFTIESWMMVSSGIAGGDRSFLSTLAFGPTRGWSMTTSGSFTFTLNLADSSVFISAQGLTAINDNRWHLNTAVVDRTADTVELYIDGVLDRTISISTMTGSISSGALLQLTTQTQEEIIAFDEICITLKAMSSTEVGNRAAGKTNFGTWGM